MAAGLGFKTFTTGEVLTAADTNGYLMQGINVFASTAARNAAITSPQEGQFAFTKDTNSLWYYDGAAWVASGATGDIEGVTAGVGISGGGTSGTVTVTNSMATAIDAKGDLIAGTGADAFSKIPAGANNTVLIADSAEATGLKYTSSLTGLTTITTSADSTVNGMKIGIGGGGFSSTTIVGNGALAANTTGQYNSAVGQGALAANTTSQQSTAVGMLALNASNGSSNSAFGQYALGQVTSGSQNTGLGMYAGSNLLTGNNNIIIGHNAQASSTSVSNTVTLGDSSITTIRAQVTSITSLSDERDKKDITPLEHGLDFVKQLKPVSFEWNTRPQTSTDFEGNEIQIQGKVGISDIGFIAQDIVALEDSLSAADSLQLSFRDNPEKLEVTQGRLIPILVKAIQDLASKVEALETAK